MFCTYFVNCILKNSPEMEKMEIIKICFKKFSTSKVGSFKPWCVYGAVWAKHLFIKQKIYWDFLFWCKNNTKIPNGCGQLNPFQIRTYIIYFLFLRRPFSKFIKCQMKVFVSSINSYQDFYKSKNISPWKPIYTISVSTNIFW